MNEHRVSAILVVHDGATWLPEVVAALASQDRPFDSIVAVDTGSKDSSAKLVQGARIPLLSMEREAGFGDAIAYAISQLKEPDPERTEWLWIIHDDLAPQRGALRALLEAVSTRPNVAMAGPKLLGWHNHTHLLEVGISIAGNGARWTGLEPSEYDQGQRDGVHEVLSVSTAGALIRRDVFEELGGFDSNLELFRDDVDFGWRVRVAGHGVIAVTDAVAFHAEAAASERRSVDVKGAFLHRPLLLDRRNAAYVLLANSSWWLLPLLALRIFGGAILRALGYLFAKLPGYAGDEILAIGTLFSHPAELVNARKDRRRHRLVSPRVVVPFIPPGWSQIRLTLTRASQWIRNQILPDARSEIVEQVNPTQSLDDEDLLVPATTRPWLGLLKKPSFLVISLLFITTILWSRQRFGAVSGGGLPGQLPGARDLWQSYLSGWHYVGMGSSSATPPWVPLVALLSLLFAGNVPLLMTIIFFVAPIILFLSSYQLLRKFSQNRWLVALSAGLYAISPVTVSAINSGRLSTLVVLALLPPLIILVQDWELIERVSWRRIFSIALLVGVIFSFSPSMLIFVALLTGWGMYHDYLSSHRTFHEAIFKARFSKRLALLLTPIFLTAPWSFELFLAPHRFLLDAGFLVPGGGQNLTLIGNPGGPGALPWWVVSPIAVVLVITYFSTTYARKIAQAGIAFLLGATLLSAFSISGNGTFAKLSVYSGTLTACATLAAIAASVVMLDQIRDRLVSTHLNFRHYSAALLLVVTFLYSMTSISWIVTEGASSPLRSSKESVLPAFLSVEKDAKILVLRQSENAENPSLSFYIARGGDITLGLPDVAPRENVNITQAVRELANSTGISSSSMLAAHGIKYLFLTATADKNIVRTIDGLGGFTRTSSTSVGIVWKISGVSGSLVYTDSKGVSSLITPQEISQALIVTGAGTITLTESYSRSWQISQNGKRLERSRNENGLPVFAVQEAGEITVRFDGSLRRGWVSLELIALVSVIIFALPAGRRKREISEEELA
jgi:GT2 family glycosyltransferase